MALSPVFRVNDGSDGVTKVRGHRQALQAVTKYRVLDSAGGCSLVELQPLTGKTSKADNHVLVLSVLMEIKHPEVELKNMVDVGSLRDVLLCRFISSQA